RRVRSVSLETLMFQRTASLISSTVHLYTQTDKHLCSVVARETWRQGRFHFLEIFGLYESFVEHGSQYPERDQSSCLLVVSTPIALPLPPPVTPSLRSM